MRKCRCNFQTRWGLTMWRFGRPASGWLIGPSSYYYVEVSFFLLVSKEPQLWSDFPQNSKFQTFYLGANISMLCFEIESVPRVGRNWFWSNQLRSPECSSFPDKTPNWSNWLRTWNFILNTKYRYCSENNSLASYTGFKSRYYILSSVMGWEIFRQLWRTSREGVKSVFECDELFLTKNKMDSLNEKFPKKIAINS